MAETGGRSPDPGLERAVEDALNRSVRESLDPAALVAGGVFSVLAVAHLLVVTAPARIPLAAAAAASAAFAFVLRRRWRRATPGLARTHAAMGLLAALLLLNSTLHLGLVREPIHTTNFALFQVAVGFLLLSHAWFAAGLAAGLVCWTLLAISGPPEPAWIHFGFLLFMASALGAAIHFIRVRTIGRLEASRWASDLRRQRVEQESRESLRRSEARSRALLGAIPDLIFLLRRDGTYLDFVEPSPGSTYVRPDDFLGRRMEDVLPGEVARPAVESIEKALVTGEVVEFEYRLPMQGELRDFEARLAPCTKDEVLAIVRDVTEQRRVEAQVRHTQKLESLGVLAGGVAHDFNNLLAGILGNAELARRQLPPESDERVLIEQIVLAAERAAGLTKQLLAYAGKGSLRVASVDLGARAREIVPLLSSSIAKHVELRLALAEGLPCVEADPAQLQQVVMNLVLNGADACGEKPGVVTVATREALPPQGGGTARGGGDGSPSARWVCLEVRDTGCGMEEAVSSRIFDPFFTTKSAGRGLGLAVVHGIVSAHGGTIQVDSAPGRGSTFRVFLPASARAAVETTEEVSRELSGEGVILAIDDEALMRNLLRRVLSWYGYQVLTAEDGRRGVELFRERAGAIDLVLVDVNMPGMRGDATLRALRAIRPDVKAILISGYEEAEATRSLDEEQPFGFLQKPFRPAVLAARVRDALQPPAAG